jgi:hypothetical protein
MEIPIRYDFKTPPTTIPFQNNIPMLKIPPVINPNTEIRIPINKLLEKIL